jgi:hypothetical protein
MNTAQSTEKSLTLVQWNFVAATSLFVMAFLIFIGWKTPAICYQTTSAFGIMFVLNGFLGTTRLRTSVIWKTSSYFVGIIIALFASIGLYRQLSQGEHGQIVGSTYYSICSSLFLIGVIALVFLVLCRRDFALHGNQHENG